MISSLSSDPLFSSIVALYTLILLYFPTHFIRIVFSPLLISTGVLLLTLLRFGAVQKLKHSDSPESEKQHPHHFSGDDRKWVSVETDCGSETETGSGSVVDRNPFSDGMFLEWDVRAPLEVIYEGYEGEEDDDGGELAGTKETRFSGIERYASLSLCYPETDSDVSSDGDFSGIENWDSPESSCFRWDDEDREGLIEIALGDGKRKSEERSQLEEENLIEIDLSPATSR